MRPHLHIATVSNHCFSQNSFAFGSEELAVGIHENLFMGSPPRDLPQFTISCLGECEHHPQCSSWCSHRLHICHHWLSDEFSSRLAFRCQDDQHQLLLSPTTQREGFLVWWKKIFLHCCPRGTYFVYFSLRRPISCILTWPQPSAVCSEFENRILPLLPDHGANSYSRPRRLPDEVLSYRNHKAYASF